MTNTIQEAGKVEIQTSRQVVLECTHRLAQRGIFVGTGGNVSVRIPGSELIAITPSGKDYLGLDSTDICVCDTGGVLVEGPFKPSIETGMHLAVYHNRPDVNAIVHTHQVYASTFAVMAEPIPALFDEQVMNMGTQVDVVPYGLSGSQELLANVAGAVVNRCNAFILQNHGVLLLGIDLEEAERNVGLLEKTAMVYYHALIAGRTISKLDPAIADFIFSLLKDRQDKEIARKQDRL
jgi:hypothetical protein